MKALPAASALLFASLITACATVPTAEEEALEALEFSSIEAEINYYLTIGDLAMSQRDYDAAVDAYLAVMELTDDAGVAEQATRLALHQDRYEAAARAARRWRELLPSDVRAADAQLVTALRGGNERDAALFLRSTLSLRGAPEPEAFQAVARLMFDESANPMTRRLMAAVAAEYDTAHAWHAAALVAMRADDLDLAARAVRRGRAQDPEWAQLAMVEARLLMLQGDPDGGLALMRALVADNADDPTLRYALGGLYLTMGRYEEALVELRTVVEDSPAYLDARWTLAMLLMQLREPEQATTHLRELLADPVRRWDVPYYMGGAYEMMEEWATALEWFEQVEWGDNVVNAGIKAAQMLFNLDRIDEGRARLYELRDEHRSDLERLYQVEAELLARADVDAEALVVLDEAVRAVPDSVALRYSRALIRDRGGDYEGAIADLRWVYERRPDSHEAQNALGYVLADRSGPDDWPEARQLIERAVEQRPDSAAYLDSMGWVLFRLGELEEALDWLERSWALDRNPEVGAHLGEVLWVMGRRGDARAVWDEAAEVDPDHPVLQETLQRLDP